MSGAENILVTGPPGCGKSTLVEKLVERLPGPKTGFFTREIRTGRQRVGFGLTTLDGREGVLAHVDLKGGPRVGKYIVNLEDIDRIAAGSMRPRRVGEIVVIDEIGKMECLSRLFRRVLVEVLDSEHRVIGSIAQKGDRFIQGIKARPDVRLIEVTRRNRDALAEQFSQFA